MHKNLEEIEEKLINNHELTVNDLFDRTMTWRMLFHYLWILVKKFFKKKDKKFKSIF